METTTISINDLISPTYNPRQISKEEMQKLENSITEFGLVSPIVINLKNNHIIGGNQRFNTLLSINQKKGDFYKELTLIKLGDIGLAFIDEDLKVEDEDHEKALNLALNKISGDWDNDKLRVVLEEIELSPIDVSLTGFDDIELTEMEIYEEPSMEDIVEDEYQEDNIETNIQQGDLFKLGAHYLLCGDSTLTQDIDKLLTATGERESIDMILTDVPYGMGLDTDYSVMQSKLKFYQEKNCNGAGNKYLQGVVDDFQPKIIENIFKLNVKETFLWGANYYTEHLQNINEGSWIVWDKRSNEDTEYEKIIQSDKMFGSCFELCWSKNKHKQEIARVKWAGIFGTETEFDHKRHHPTQKPIKLSSWFINKYSNENNIILDLTAGSGSTLLAAEQTNRKCYAMEIEPHYCQIIINRWEEYTNETATKIN